MRRNPKITATVGPVLLLALMARLDAGSAVLLERESVWRFFPGLSEPSSPATAWRLPGFDDTAWVSGPAPFGFGDLPLGTDLSQTDPPMQSHYSTFYLRRTFEVEEALDLRQLHALVDYDDGFIVWVNGVEVLRLNAPALQVPHDGRAAAGHESGSYVEFPLPAPKDYINTGTNTISVHALNASVGNDDARFALELLDSTGPDRTPPSVETVAPEPDTVVRQLSRIAILFNEGVRGVEAADLLVNGVAATGLSEGDQGEFIFVFPQPPIGEVEVEWAADSGITDLARIPNAFVGGSWTYTLNLTAPPQRLVISEFLASNGGGLEDEDGDTKDWIEIHHRGSEPVNLAGWSLTDDTKRPRRWTFPMLSFRPGEYLVVFASGKDRTPSGGELHTNFRLGRSGEDLALFTSDSPPIGVSELSDYPEQRTDHSYGESMEGEVGYFLTPTPGGPRVGDALLGLAAEVEVSADAGLFSELFPLELTTSSADAEIYYTLDGSAPTPGSGFLYTEPLEVSGSARRAVVTLRAATYRARFVPSAVTTRSYIFPEFVLSQPGDPDGFPMSWTGAPVADYEMDPQVVQNPARAQGIAAGLRSLPAVSIVMDVESLFGSAGLYSNPAGSGVLWERPASLEFIQPDGGDGFQVDCGLRIHGGASRNPSNSPKHGLRVLFKSVYGPDKLRFPVFPDSSAAIFDTLIFRASYNNSWVHSDESQRRRAQLLHDQWARDTQRDMGHVASHGRFVTLYLNGLFWGVYNLVERPSASFCATYLGGEKEEWDVYNATGVVDGEGESWSTLMALREQSPVTLGSYLALANIVDLAGFVDYMLLNFYAGNRDWPGHNWYAARRRGPSGTFKFFSWDAERILESTLENRLLARDDNSLGDLFSRLREQPEFRLAFADRVEKHCFGAGALTPAAAAGRWATRAAEVEKAVLLEEARWGDYRRDVEGSAGTLYRYDPHWLAEKERLMRHHFPERAEIFLRQLVNAGLYPELEAPIFGHGGGGFEPGFTLELRGPQDGGATLYFTTDGRDPRVLGTGVVSHTAGIYTGPIPLRGRTVVKARAVRGDTWSALSEAVFFPVGSHAGDVVISEILYAPEGGGDHEFLELHNTGVTPANLSGVKLVGGIDFVFPEGESLLPGAYLVLVADSDRFEDRFPEVRYSGVFMRRLANEGEKITLQDATGSTLFCVDDYAGDLWPVSPAVLGHSLVLVDFGGSPDDPRAWRASARVDGSPGVPDPEPLHAGVVIHEVLLGSGSPGMGSMELHNLKDFPLDVSGWFLGNDRIDEVGLKRFRIPSGTVLAPRGYAVLAEEVFRAGPGAPGGLELEELGGELYLASADASGTLTGYVSGVSYGALVDGFPFGRHETGASVEFTALSHPTPGARNAAPRRPQVAINEIHYHPLQGAREFVELHNTGSREVSLGGWKLGALPGSEGLDSFTFSAGVILPAGGYLLLVPTDPETFGGSRQVPAEAIVVGPYGGALENSGGELRLEKPLDGFAGVYVEVDRVRYNDREPWPSEPDGKGMSLERIRPSEYGNEVFNWAASTTLGGTPGADNTVTPQEPPPSRQVPGDLDQDGRLVVADVIALLGYLFQGIPPELPCGGGTLESSGNRGLADADGSSKVDLSDAIYVLGYLFKGGPAHALGATCVEIVGCPQGCP
jgi:hypothetical protein